MDERALRDIRGNDISMIFQEPMTSLNPVFTVGDQIAEAIRLHRGKSRAEARALAVEMLDRVGIADPDRRVADYPHQMSGGMRQRAMIAMALSCNPTVLIADEPTTALDVTIQAQILDLMRTLQRVRGADEHRLHQPQPRRRRGHGRPGGSHVRRAHRRGGDGRRHLQVAATPLHNRAPQQHSAKRPQGEEALEDYRLEAIPGNVPDPMNLPAGCAFEPRCGHAVADRGSAVPALAEIGAGHHSRCIRWAEL